MRSEVAEELRRAASILERQASFRVRLADSARIGWQGPHRQAFEEEHRRLAAEARALTEALRRAAATAASAERDLVTRVGRFS